MEKHLLVAVSEHQGGLFGVRFVGHFFSTKAGLNITLFYTMPKPSAGWQEDRDRQRVAERMQQARRYEARGRKALEEAQKVLQQMGFEENRIGMKLTSRQVSKLNDIIREGETGQYDAVVLGRRGISWLEETFDESVTRGLMDKLVAFPMWICRRPDVEYKNVLLCVDGSDCADRMADHVGFILGQKNSQRVTLFFVNKAGALSKKGADRILDKAKKNLLTNGFPEDMTTTKVVDSSNTARAILTEATRGRYAAVATGRTGAGGGFLKKLFMGSVSAALFRELEKNALWLCY